MTTSEVAYSSLNVARLANLPNEVITIASEKSRTMEEETKQREAQRWYFHLQTRVNRQERESTRTGKIREHRHRSITRTSQKIGLKDIP